MTEKTKLKVDQKTDKIKIIPLGGLEDIGMNITAFEYKNSIIVVDCGMAFPDEKTPGIDLIIPNVTYLKNNIEKVKGFFITHGHEDHIGALPYILKEINVPVHATKLTMGIINHKLDEHRMISKVKRKVVKFGQNITAGDFKIEFIRTNHSIQDSAALAIQTEIGTIIHTGDFKVDYTPIYGDTIDLARFAELGKKGVLAMLCDSTNAERQGFTMSEKSVGKTLEDVFEKNKERRIIISTFASNVDRVQQIINTAYKLGRKVVIDGRSMVNIIRIATELQYINIPDNTLIDIEELKNYEDKDTVIITTGSQGEQMASLSRIAYHKHQKIRATSNDTIIFSSHPIPGNEKAVTEIINALMSKGAKVVEQDVHVSGHACQEDIKLLYSLVKPLYSIPIHGEYKHRFAQTNIARDLGYDEDHIKLISSGDILEINEDAANIVDTVKYGQVLVDGNGVGNVGNIVIKERQQLSQDGIIVIVMTFVEGRSIMLSNPEIICRGFVYMKESQELLNKMYDVLDHSLSNYLRKHKTINWTDIKEIVKTDMTTFLWTEMKSKPMILPVIMEV